MPKMSTADQSSNSPANPVLPGSSPLAIGDETLTAAAVARFAQGGIRAVYTAESRTRIAAAHQTLLDVARSRPVYGLSTGVGARRFVAVQRSADSCLRLWRSHALQYGPLVDESRVRATLLIRAHQIARGGSGVSPALAESLIDAASSMTMPHLRFGGSLGTGDLGALATVALHLVNSSETGTAPETNDSAGTFAPSDGLPFMSSSALTLADAAVTLDELGRALGAATALAAATVGALGTTADHFDERALARRTGSVRAVADVLRPFSAAEPMRVQDPFSLRLIPQSIGAVRSIHTQCTDATTREIDGAHENPRVLIAEHRVAHTGNFYTVELALAIESLIAALAQDASLLLARISLLMDPRYTREAEFLSDGTDDATGAMMLEYVAAASLAEIRDAASASGGHGVHLSLGAEEHAPFTPQSIRRLHRAGEAYRTMLACAGVALMRLPAEHGVSKFLHDAPRPHGGLEDRDLSTDVADFRDALDIIQLHPFTHAPKGTHD